ncbi:MAG: CsbD family protein [Lysobacteraceae bacterium]
MDKNRTVGTKHEIKGAVKEFVGKVTGDRVKEAKGNAEKNIGKVQKAAGVAIDKARDANKKIV